MSQVLRGPNSRCAIEVLRTGSEAILAVLDTDCSIALISHPLAWAESGPQFKTGRAFLEFDQVWKPLLRQGPKGIEPYPLLDAVRKFIKGCYAPPFGFKSGALDALVEVLPSGEHHLFTREAGFIGRFASLDDATMIAGALKAVKPIIFSTAEEFMELVDLDQGVVLSDLDPVKEWPAKIDVNIAMGVLEMAKAKKKDKTKKVAKAEATQRRADGPVAQARMIFEAMKSETDSSKIIAACEAKGINRGTATTQLGRWRKENGITVKRGGARKKAAEKAPPSGKKADKKGKKGKEKDGIPPSPKGAKRHKPAAKPSGKPDESATTPSSSSSGQKQSPSPVAASAQTEKAATASTGSGQATIAGAAAAASSPSPAPASTPSTAKK